jgi:hypothetical protein
LFSRARNYKMKCVNVMTIIRRDNVKRRPDEILTTRCRLTRCADIELGGMFHALFENARPTTIYGGAKDAVRALRQCLLKKAADIYIIYIV